MTGEFALPFVARVTQGFKMSLGCLRDCFEGVSNGLLAFGPRILNIFGAGTWSSWICHWTGQPNPRIESIAGVFILRPNWICIRFKLEPDERSFRVLQQILRIPQIILSPAHISTISHLPHGCEDCYIVRGKTVSFLVPVLA